MRVDWELWMCVLKRHRQAPPCPQNCRGSCLDKFLLNIPHYLFHPHVNRSLWKFWWKRMDVISTHLHCGLPLALAPSPVCFSDDNVKSVIKKYQNRLKLTARLPLIHPPMIVHSSAAQLRITVELLECHVSLVTKKIWRLNFCLPEGPSMRA